MSLTKKIVGKILGDRKSKNSEEDKTDDAGNCKGCGMAYSFYFGKQFHKKGCKYADQD